MKPGIKTTELLVTVLADVGLVAFSISGALPAKWASVAVAVSTAAYAISRGLAKQGTPGA